MKYDYDVLTIGLGPAGMAISVMGAEMGLNVCGIEKRWIGGECQNVGCIPSKSLLRMAQLRHSAAHFKTMGLAPADPPAVAQPFRTIQAFLDHIRDNKTVGMFEKVNLVVGEGPAEFVDPHTVRVVEKQFTAKRIFICVGTQPAVPPIPGLDGIDYLTNENVFHLESVPSSMVILGGGAIGCELAQAFSRLGCHATIVHMDPHLVPPGDPDAGALLEACLKEEGVEVYNGRTIRKAARENGKVVLYTDRNERLEGERLLVGAGRSFDFAELRLENAGITVGRRGIPVDKHLRTNHRHIFACGDCNGHFLLTHAAMHQGMLALMNAMLPWPMKQDFRKYAVPWTVFTEPQISQVGLSERQLNERGIAYETIMVRYEDYGAAIAEGVGVGFVKVFASKLGRIYGACIVGEGSGEMINAWGMAIQQKLRLHSVMMLQHSFPTMGFLSKRSADTWMMNRMKSESLKGWARFMYRL